MSKRVFKIKGYGDEKDISDSKISEYSTIDYPLFSFKYLCSNISIKKCSRGKFFFNFLSRLKELSNAGWKVIEKSDRHSLGTEKNANRQDSSTAPRNYYS